MTLSHLQPEVGWCWGSVTWILIEGNVFDHRPPGVTSSLELVIDCKGAAEFVWFVILNTILGNSGIFFDSSGV